MADRPAAIGVDGASYMLPTSGAQSPEHTGQQGLHIADAHRLHDSGETRQFGYPALRRKRPIDLAEAKGRAESAR